MNRDRIKLLIKQAERVKAEIGKLLIQLETLDERLEEKAEREELVIETKLGRV